MMPKKMHKKSKKHQAAFTLLEVIIAAAILALMAAVSVMAFQSYHRSVALRTATDEVKAALLNARNSTLAGESDSVYGVHIDQYAVIQFKGSTFDPADSDNVKYSFAGDVTATTSLSGAASEVVFERLTGVPNATGTILLESEDASTTKTVVVHASGLIE